MLPAHIIYDISKREQKQAENIIEELQINESICNDLPSEHLNDRTKDLDKSQTASRGVARIDYFS